MNSARSLWKLLVSGVGVVVLASNCVVKTSDGDSCAPGDRADCTCSGDRAGEKVCNSSGTGYGSCVCDATGTGGATATGGSGSTSGGSSNGGSATGGSGATSGGSSTVGGAGGDGNAGAAGEAGSTAQGGSTSQGGAGGIGGSDGDAGGAGGAGGGSYDDCDTCLGARCAAEFDACLSSETCISSDPVGNPGQFDQIVECVETKRATQAVKRADLRACGTAVGTGSAWPPDEMNVETLNLVNCLASGDAGIPNNNSWADDDNLSKPWVGNSCAKLACTSAL